MYTGRFAPSPTGPLHFGSLLAALASWLDARHHQGQWLLRIEDLDPPRESLEAPSIILTQLEQLGLYWDQQPLFQSQRLAAYDDALQQLWQDGHLFYCNCSRRQVGPVYAGTCRQRRSLSQTSDAETMAVRFRVDESALIAIDDRILGPQQWRLKDLGDFIVRRRDGLFAYQLAVVVDDAFQQVTHLVRGSDLLASTPRQISLTHALGCFTPDYAHLPLVLGADGHKLSKQAHARAIDTAQPAPLIRAALNLLGQPLPDLELDRDELLNWAIAHWSVGRVPRNALAYVQNSLY